MWLVVVPRKRHPWGNAQLDGESFQLLGVVAFPAENGATDDSKVCQPIGRGDKSGSMEELALTLPRLEPTDKRYQWSAGGNAPV